MASLYYEDVDAEDPKFSFRHWNLPTKGEEFIYDCFYILSWVDYFDCYVELHLGEDTFDLNGLLMGIHECEFHLNYFIEESEKYDFPSIPEDYDKIPSLLICCTVIFILTCIAMEHIEKFAKQENNSIKDKRISEDLLKLATDILPLSDQYRDWLKKLYQ